MHFVCVFLICEKLWNSATIMSFMPRAKDHVIHFGDGHAEGILLPVDLESIRFKAESDVFSVLTEERGRDVSV